MHRLPRVLLEEAGGARASRLDYGEHSSSNFFEEYGDVHLAVEAARAERRPNGQVGAVGVSAGATHAPVRDYTAITIPGDLHCFANWAQIKSDVLAFLATNLGSGGR